jgi:hypothetical protein
MKRIVTACAIACLILISSGRSAANVTTIGVEPAAGLEVVDDQFRGPGADLSGAAIPVSRYGSFNWPGSGRHFVDAIPCDTAGWAGAAKAEAACSPWEMASPLDDARGNLALTVDEYSGSLLPPNTFASVHAANIAYTDLTHFGDASPLGDIAFQPNLPSGAIVLAGLGAGLIGWSWRRRVLSCGKYP